MKIIKFTIKNFRGIVDTALDLADEAPGNVITLIGLNESGKTTILEALSHFFTEDKETASLVGTVQQRSSLQDLIPKSSKAAFTGRIVISAEIELNDDDISALADFFKRTHNLALDTSTMARRLPVERAYDFVDSANTESNAFWTVVFPLKTKQQKTFRRFNHTGDMRAVWLSGVGFLREQIPLIVYFPTFLFNFPDRIYLEGDKLSDVNLYYRQVIQDILDSLGSRLSIQKHIVDRIKKHRDPFANPLAFIAHFLTQDEKSQIDAVMQAISNEMSKMVFGAWRDILGRNLSNKRIQVDWFLDSTKITPRTYRSGSSTGSLDMLSLNALLDLDGSSHFFCSPNFA